MNQPNQTWDAAMAAFAQAKADADAFDPIARAALEQEADAIRQIGHTTLRPDPYSGRTEPVTTADEGYVRRARQMIAAIAAGRCKLDLELDDLRGHYELICELARAADERDAKIAAISAGLGIEEIESKLEALGEAEYATQWALMDLPAPSLPALLWKLEIAFTPDVDGADASLSPYTISALSQTIADMRRLLGGEG